MADILVIEDEESVRSTLRSILEFGGHKVSEASNGEEGLGVLRKLKPDLVLCDITMPKLGGYDVLKELRQGHPELAELPFLFLSAHAGRTDILEGISLGADDYLTKPIDHKMLLVKVEATLRQVTRMQRKKEQEHVKLYKALTQTSYAEGASPTIKQQLQPPPEKHSGSPAPDFDHKLRETVRRGTKGSAGALHFINLAELKRHLGGRWKKVSATAMSVAEAAIRRHLAEGSIFHRYGSEGFLVLLPDLTEKNAVYKVESIANEICVNLLAEDDDDYQQLSLTSTVGGLKELLKDSPTPPSLPDLARAFEKRRSRADQGGVGAQTLANRILQTTTVKFLPVWKPDEERVVAYQACACLPTGQKIFPTHGGWREGSEAPLASRVRSAMAEKVMAYLSTRRGEDSGATICLPVHLSALVGASRKNLEEILDRIPNSELRSALMIELIVPHADLKPEFVTGAMGAVTERSQQVAVRCSPRHPQARLFADSGAAIMSMQVGARYKNQDAGRLSKKLRAFVQGARVMGLDPYALGIETRQGVGAAVQAGCRLVAGRGVGREMNYPGNHLILQRRQFVFE